MYSGYRQHRGVKWNPDLLNLINNTGFQPENMPLIR